MHVLTGPACFFFSPILLSQPLRGRSAFLIVRPSPTRSFNSFLSVRPRGRQFMIFRPLGHQNHCAILCIPTPPHCTPPHRTAPHPPHTHTHTSTITTTQSPQSLRSLTSFLIFPGRHNHCVVSHNSLIFAPLGRHNHCVGSQDIRRIVPTAQTDECVDKSCALSMHFFFLAHFAVTTMTISRCMPYFSPPAITAFQFITYIPLPLIATTTA